MLSWLPVLQSVLAYEDSIWKKDQKQWLLSRYAFCNDIFELLSYVIQAVAAVGQGRLIRLYDDLFGQFHQPVAQILLTKNDLSDVRFIHQVG